jgi:hypothetical protein
MALLLATGEAMFIYIFPASANNIKLEVTIARKVLPQPHTQGMKGSMRNLLNLLLLLLLLKLYLHTVFSSGFNMQQTKLDKLQK